MKKKAMALLFAAALLLSCSVLAAADSPANEARNGVVRIAEVFYSDGEISDIWIGTGFFVGQEGQNVQYLVTNHHVVSDYLENDKGEQFLYRDQYGTQHKGQFVIDVFFSTGDFVEAYVVDADEGQDIALLKLEKPTGERIALPLLVPDEKMVGDTVYAVGLVRFSSSCRCRPESRMTSSTPPAPGGWRTPSSPEARSEGSSPSPAQATAGFSPRICRSPPATPAAPC